MRFIALALILASLPAFIAWLRSRPAHRPYALAIICALFFSAGTIKVDAAFITWPMWSGPVRGIQISIIDTLALALIFTRKKTPVSIPFTWTYWLYLSVLAFSVLMSSVWMASAFAVYEFCRVFLILIAVAPELLGRPGVIGVLQGFSLGLMLQGGSVILQKGHGVVQASGTGFHQNTLGIMTELTLIPIVAVILGGERSKLLKIGALAGLVIVAGGGSRATMIYVVGGLGILIVLSLIQQSTPVKWKVLGVGIAAAVLIAPLAIKTMSARFGSNAMLGEDGGRAAMEKAALAMSADHPLGVGVNMYTTTGNIDGYSERAGVSWGGNTRGAPVHNSYLLARAETGWHGELVFLLWLIVPIVAGFRQAFQSRRDLSGSLALGSAVALSVMALHVNVEFAAHTYTVQNLVAINGGLIASGLMLAQMRRRGIGRGARRPVMTDGGQRGDGPDPNRSYGDIAGPRGNVRPT